MLTRNFPGRTVEDNENPQLVVCVSGFMYVCLKILVNNQLDDQFFYICVFQFSTCFEQPSAHHQESQLYQYNLWNMSLCR